MNAVILACSSMARQVAAAQRKMGTDYPVRCVDRRYHAEPKEMRLQLIAALGGLAGEFDIVLVAMGFCGGSWESVYAPVRVVAPRVDDCITLLLGSPERRKQLDETKRGYFLTEGWLQGEAKRSKLLEGRQVTSIPNPIDVRTFAPGNKAEARRQLGLPEERRLMLFVAQRVSNVNKGAAYLIEACRALVKSHPDMASNLGVVTLGGSGDELASAFDVPVYPLGYITDTHKIVAAYRAADVFVMPSLSENLPNTIMEAMACGVPCVGFNVGGIPEMIDHMKNGYVAQYKNAADLAEGIRWTLAEADREALACAAVGKVARTYSQQSVALKYIELYNQALAYKHYRL